MNYPKITVVTPSYNQGEFIERTILSIISQNYPNLEYFIIDGGSTDNTVEIIKKYQDKIDYWVSEKDRGQTDAINKGMRRATGDIVCWINSDDVLLPNALLTVREYVLKYPKVDFFNGITIEIDKDDNILKCTGIIINKWLFKHGAKNISQQGMFWKRRLFEEVGFLDESFHALMDLEFQIRIYELNKSIKLINKPLGAIRIYADTKTALGGKIWDDDKMKLFERYNGAYLNNHKSIYYCIFLLKKVLHGIYLKNYMFERKYKGKQWMCIK